MKKLLTILILAVSCQVSAQDSTRIPTNKTYKAYGHEFPIFYDGIKKKLYYMRTANKRFYIKNKG